MPSNASIWTMNHGEHGRVYRFFVVDVFPRDHKRAQRGFSISTDRSQLIHTHTLKSTLLDSQET